MIASVGNVTQVRSIPSRLLDEKLSGKEAERGWPPSFIDWYQARDITAAFHWIVLASPKRGGWDKRRNYKWNLSYLCA